MSSVLIHFPESIFHGNGIQISSMDYVTMSDIHFSYDLLKIEGEEVDQYLNDAIQKVSETTDTELNIQEDGVMKGGYQDTFMYGKFRQMVDYVKNATFDTISGKNELLKELLAPVNKPENVDTTANLKKDDPLPENKEEVNAEEEKETTQSEQVPESGVVSKEEIPTETDETKEQQMSETEETKEEVETKEEDEKKTDVTETKIEPEEKEEPKNPESDEKEEYDEENGEEEKETKKANENAVEDSEKGEEETDRKDLESISDIESQNDENTEDIVAITEVIITKKNEDTLIELLELKMTKLAFQSEN